MIVNWMHTDIPPAPSQEGNVFYAPIVILSVSEGSVYINKRFQIFRTESSTTRLHFVQDDKGKEAQNVVNKKGCHDS